MPFFKKEKVKSIKLEEHRKKLFKPYKQGCGECGLYKECFSPKMKPTGKGLKNIYILGEASGKIEDELNKQFVGPTGQFLRETIYELDLPFSIDLDEDCIFDNACRCRPTTKSEFGNIINRPPKNKEINTCREKILSSIKKHQPEKILLLGKSALISFLGHRTTNIGSIGKWVGFKIPDQELNSWIFPIYHPSFVYQNQENIALQKIFKNQLYDSFTWDKHLSDYQNMDSNVQILNNVENVISLFQTILLKRSPVVFDYETTGKKPHAPGHKIICMSISLGPFEAYAFPFFENEKFKKLWKQILTDKRIGKLAYNFRFEHIWTKVILGYDVQGWITDPMNNAHIIDNRSGITGLKFQTYINYGILGYDNEVEQYIDGGKGGNNFNHLLEMPQDKLLLYCGLDSLFTYLLWNDQNKIINSWPKIRRETIDFYTEVNKTFCKIEQTGFTTKSNYYEMQDIHLDRRIERCLNKIKNSKEGLLWKEEEGKEFNPRSPDHLKKLLFQKLKYKSIKETEKGGESTDKDVLLEINTPFTNLLLEYKSLYKLKNTYLAGFIREKYNNKLFTSNLLNIARTQRTSSVGPNMQNVPNRDEEARKLTRSGIIPSKGNQLLCVDYGRIEVKVGACYHKDPIMLKYERDPSTDMHRDTAISLFLLDKEEVTKNIRYYAKNAFVFPQFYGSYFAQCAPNLWKAMDEKLDSGITLRKHLIQKGIINYDDFEAHVADVEYKFWYERFTQYTEWKEEIWEFYQKNLFIESLDGFRFTGLMKRNDVFDYMIQGGACHCLLWSMVQIHKFLKVNGYKSKIIGQIHDELLINAIPKEVEVIYPMIKKIMCEDIKKYYKWIIVPLTVEASITDVNGSWHDKKEMEI